LKPWTQGQRGPVGGPDPVVEEPGRDPVAPGRLQPRRAGGGEQGDERHGRAQGAGRPRDAGPAAEPEGRSHPLLRRAGELQEDVLEVGLLGGEVGDGEPGVVDGGEDLRGPGLAGAIADDQAPGRLHLHLEARQGRRHPVQVLGHRDRQLLAVQPAQQRSRLLAADEPAVVDDGDALAKPRRRSTSTPAVGSSSTRIGGECTSALATIRRRRMPPERVRA
jgi:hypothetical protein